MDKDDQPLDPTEEEKEEDVEITPEEAKLPEHMRELHEGLVVVSSKIWIGTAVFATLVGAVIVWSFLGALPIILEGAGIFTTEKGIFKVSNLEPGIVDEIWITPGQEIKKGDPLVKVFNQENEIRLENLLVKQKETKRRLEELKITIEKEIKAQKEELEAEISANNFEIEETSRNIKSLEEILENKQSLYRQGLLNLETVRQAENAVSQAKAQLKSAWIKAKTLQKKVIAEYRPDDIKQKERELLDLEESIELLEIKQALNTIKAPYDGTVIEVKVRKGQLINQGDPVAFVEHTSSGPEETIVVAYVSVDKGKKIEVGNVVDIEPATVNSFEYGVMRGVVTSVSSHAVSPEEMKRRVFNNEGIARHLMSGQDAVVEILIKPYLNPKTYSGYQWTSLQGPDEKISTGTVSKVKITIDEISPIYYVFPLWRVRKTVGL